MTRAGIIAAGEGSRLQAAFPGVPKPLVPVGGRPLIAWTVAGLEAAGARAVTIILNTAESAVERYLRSEFERIEWDVVTQDTASSWESFSIVAARLAAKSDRFLISTVDALASKAQLRRLSDAFARSRRAAALAVTRHVDDEKPLWAQVDDGRVVAVGAGVKRRELVTCGLYGLSRQAAQALPAASEFSRLREFWSWLAARPDLEIEAVELDKTLDVDRPEDVRQAEQFLAGGSIA